MLLDPSLCTSAVRSERGGAHCGPNGAGAHDRAPSAASLVTGPRRGGGGAPCALARLAALLVAGPGSLYYYYLRAGEEVRLGAWRPPGSGGSGVCLGPALACLASMPCLSGALLHRRPHTLD